MSSERFIDVVVYIVEQSSFLTESGDTLKIVKQGKLENMAAFLLRRGRDYREPKLNTGLRPGRSSGRRS